MRIGFVGFLFLIINLFTLSAQNAPTFTLKFNESLEQFVIETDARIRTLNAKINGKEMALQMQNGNAIVDLGDANTAFISIKHEGQTIRQFYRLKDTESGKKAQNIPLWLSIIPPLVAIVLALLVREVIISLFTGIFLGAWILNGFTFSGLVSGFFRVCDTYIKGAIADPDHVAIVLFSMLIGGMVAIISRNGGMAGVVKGLAKYANNARNSQLVTWFLGIAIFFDDYANTLIVGNTMRPVTDKFRVSREKLAYIVDSTAAPVAAVAFITTWIGAELGYIEDAAQGLGIQEGAYSMFLNSLSYAFYPVLTLGFILMLVLRNRDYGPMLAAENRSRTTGQLFRKDALAEIDNDDLEDFEPIDDKRTYWWTAVIPVAVVILGTLGGLLFTGWNDAVWADSSLSFFGKLSQTIGDSDSYSALIWSSTLAVISAIILTMIHKIMRIQTIMETMVSGFKSMLPAIIILVLAWALASLTSDLHTADYLTSIAEGRIAPSFLPMITFLLGAFIAFSTGSSWGTMAILYPIILPTTWAVSQAAGLPTEEIMPIFYNVISCVLAGSVLGDHCSPISDTTILSSLASSCNHIDHVRTQLPYALTVGFVSTFLSGFSIWVGLPAIVNYLIGFALLYAVVHFVGKPVEQAEELA